MDPVSKPAAEQDLADQYFRPGVSATDAGHHPAPFLAADNIGHQASSTALGVAPFLSLAISSGSGCWVPALSYIADTT